MLRWQFGLSALDWRFIVKIWGSLSEEMVTRRLNTVQVTKKLLKARVDTEFKGQRDSVFYLQSSLDFSFFFSGHKCVLKSRLQITQRAAEKPPRHAELMAPLIGRQIAFSAICVSILCGSMYQMKCVCACVCVCVCVCVAEILALHRLRLKLETSIEPSDFRGKKRGIPWKISAEIRIHICTLKVRHLARAREQVLFWHYCINHQTLKRRVLVC